MKLKNKLIPLTLSALLVSQATSAGSHSLSFGIQAANINSENASLSYNKEEGVIVASGNGEGVIPPKPKSISPEESSVCFLGFCLKP
ncbi:hypothetical protein [Alteromonas sp. a30]|uniref:hypothetical protein n=1 Tax=Alteromonas sp. a30 TaxID=2730917 RepID=UPI00227F72F9|nr:hypothetical protein [Alteromonas sp. a30]MCY7295833.1 hypothetical protein [Alteromonas sp. a30]